MKTTKTTFTIVSALASVILLTSCGSNTTKTQETKASSTKNQVTMTYDTAALTRKYHVCSLVPKRQQKPRLCIYKATMSLLTV